MAQLLNTTIQGFLNVLGLISVDGDIQITDSELETLLTSLNAIT